MRAPSWNNEAELRKVGITWVDANWFRCLKCHELWWVDVPGDIWPRLWYICPRVWEAFAQKGNGRPTRKELLEVQLNNH